MGRFVVVGESETWSDAAVESTYLSAQGLLKSVSLLCALRAGINVPPTLLALHLRWEPIARVAQAWGYPVMVRMDYAHLPRRKPLGGIPLFNPRRVKDVCNQLLRRGLVPILHPNIDRFRDIYSAGVLLSTGTDQARVEIVGRGFDAADLRLGKSVPHEGFTIDLGNGRIVDRNVISTDLYGRARRERIATISRLQQYANYANSVGRLLSSLTSFRPSRSQFAFHTVPTEYVPIPGGPVTELLSAAQIIQRHVLRSLPPSPVFVMSLSYMPDAGWVLWDVYGHWYRR